MFSLAIGVCMYVCIFVCFLAGLCKTTPPIFTMFSGKMAHRPRKKPLDFDGNLDHVVLGLG